MDVKTRVPGRIDEEAHVVEGVRPNETDALAEKISGDVYSRRPGRIDEAAEIVSEEASLSNEVSPNNMDPELVQAGWGRAFLAFSLLVLIWLLYEVAVFVIEIFQASQLAGMAALILVGVVIAFFGMAIKNELIAARRIDTIAKFKEDLTHFKASGSKAEVALLLEPFIERIAFNRPDLVRNFRGAVANRTEPEEYLAAFENIVLRVIDADVDRNIKKHTKMAAIMVSASPHPALDAFLMLWCGHSLIRKIACSYGIQVTGYTSVKLTKHLIISAATAAAVEAVSSAVVQKMGESFTASLGKLAAESSVSALRMYRLGRLSQQRLRPSLPVAT